MASVLPDDGARKVVDPEQLVGLPELCAVVLHAAGTAALVRSGALRRSGAEYHFIVQVDDNFSHG